MGVEKSADGTKCRNVQIVATSPVSVPRIALGTADISMCRPGDADKNGAIEINEIIAAVDTALNGCP